MAVHFWLKQILKSKIVDHLIIAQMSIPDFTLLNGLKINAFTLLQHFQAWRQKRRCNVGIIKRDSIFKFTCAHIAGCYSASMGRVDLADMLIALYRTKIMAKKLENNIPYSWHLQSQWMVALLCYLAGKKDHIHRLPLPNKCW